MHGSCDETCRSHGGSQRGIEKKSDQGRRAVHTPHGTSHTVQPTRYLTHCAAHTVPHTPCRCTPNVPQLRFIHQLCTSCTESVPHLYSICYPSCSSTVPKLALSRLQLLHSCPWRM